MPKFTLACSHYDFTTQDPDAFASHMLETGHVISADMASFLRAESADLAELAHALAAIQADPDGAMEMPEGMEIRPLSREDIENDPDMPEEVRADLLRFLDERKP